MMQGVPYGDLTPEEGDYGWIIILLKLFGEALKWGMGHAYKEYKKWQEIKEYQEELFGELQVEERQAIIGYRHGFERPSPLDKVSAGIVFIPPIFAKFGRILPHRYSKVIDLKYYKHHIFVGGWRPLEEVEKMLRESPFTFGIEEAGKVNVPSSDKLSQIRKNQERKVLWTVCENKKRPKKIFYPKPDPYRNTWEEDMAIFTFSKDPINPNKKALALSGTHAPGTVGISKVVSTYEALKELYEEAEKRHILGKDFQAIIRFKFKKYKINQVPQIRKISVEEMVEL